MLMNKNFSKIGREADAVLVEPPPPPVSLKGDR